MDTNQVKQCFVCKKTKPIIEYRLAVKKSKTYRKECKCCENSKISEYQILRNAKKNPQRYKGCNDCGRLFSTYRISDANKCRYCKSSNVERF